VWSRAGLLFEEDVCVLTVIRAADELLLILYLSKSTACRDQVRTSLAIELHESRVCVWVSVQYEHVLHVN